MTKRRGAPVGVVLTLRFGIIWGLSMSLVMKGSLGFWLLAGLVAGLMYSVITTLDIAWRHTDGGRKPMRLPPLRDATRFTTPGSLSETRERAGAALAALKVTPRWEDREDGFRAVGTTGIVRERVSIVAERTGGGVRVEIRSEPRWPWVLLDTLGRNRDNVQKLAAMLGPLPPEPPTAHRAQRHAPRQTARE